jgi:hypothetical protein
LNCLCGAKCLVVGMKDAAAAFKVPELHGSSIAKRHAVRKPSTGLLTVVAAADYEKSVNLVAPTGKY